MGTYWGNPAAHNHGATLGTQLFSLVLGSRNKYDANSADANPKLFACERLFGLFLRALAHLEDGFEPEAEARHAD